MLNVGVLINEKICIYLLTLNWKSSSLEMIGLEKLMAVLKMF